MGRYSQHTLQMIDRTSFALNSDKTLARALTKTEAVWPELEQAYALVH